MAKKTKQATEQEIKQTQSTGRKKRTRDGVVRDEILKHLNAVEKSYLELAKLINEAYHQQFYREKWGYETFDEYCRTELDMAYRSAINFVHIWDKVLELNLPHEEVEKLGWTKMKDLVNVMDDENYKEWIESAKTMSTRELTEAVRVSRRKDTTGAPSTTTMTFKMEESEARVVQDAIEEAKMLCDTDNAVVALEMICQDWLESKGATPKQADLQDHIKWLKKVYGVEIAVGEAAQLDVNKKPGSKKPKEPEPEPEVEPEAKQAQTAEEDELLEEAPAPRKKGKPKKKEPELTDGGFTDFGSDKTTEDESEPSIDDLLGLSDD